ncbi:MAG TPA: zf-TFIIB domain-containing protein [Candidatus Binatia bacterium]|nr:zf-TFIIB domain-containing protein [Candidatus Binatia bacterium]
MKCPKCKSQDLGPFAVEGVTVDRCPDCSGIWFDRQELSQLLAEDARRVATLRRGSESEYTQGVRGRCPRDAAQLLRVYSSIERSVILDACAECHGIWLDGGEFDKLFAARRKGPAE